MQKYRKPQTQAQRAVAPLAPIFAACQKRGLTCTNENRLARLRAINLYFAEGALDFSWLIHSFKELLADAAAILVVADAIEGGLISWA